MGCLVRPHGYQAAPEKRLSFKKIGLSESEIQSLRNARPPIPQETVIKLLHESKRTCCVCRDSKRPVVIHHIIEWSSSHDHSESNLVVLCLDHHDAAHTKKALSLSLSPDQIRRHKAKWLDQVKYEDAKAILGLASVEGARWDYINHNRLFELATKIGVKLQKHKFFRELSIYGLVHSSGLLIPHNHWTVGTPKFYLYDVGEGMLLYTYTSSILESVLSSLPLIDLTNRWSKQEILSLVKPNTWLALQSAFYFKRLTQKDKGRNQNRRGLRHRSGISIEFLFDAWDATSSSSKAIHLGGASDCHMHSFCKVYNKKV